MALELFTCFGSGVIFELFELFGIFLRAYNSVGSKCMNLKFFVLNNLTKDVQKTDIHHILAPSNTRQIVKLY